MTKIGNGDHFAPVSPERAVASTCKVSKVCTHPLSGKYINFLYLISELFRSVTVCMLNLLVLDRKIVVTRIQILRLKCTNSISAEAPPRPHLEMPSCI